MNSTFSGSAIASWPLGGARKGTGKSGKHFFRKKGTSKHIVFCKFTTLSPGEQVQFRDWLCRKESVSSLQNFERLACFICHQTFPLGNQLFSMNIVLKMRKCFRKAWESGSSGLSSFLGRYFSLEIDYLNSQSDFQTRSHFLWRSTESLDKKKKYGLPARPFKFGRS